LDEFVHTVEAHQIDRALSMCHGNQSQAAKLLGKSKQAISDFARRNG